MKIFFYYPTSKSTQPEPVLGLGILIAIALKEGHEVEFYDYDLHYNKVDFKQLITDFKPDIFAISSMTPQYFYAQQAIRFVKEHFPSCVTILGGPHASALPVQTMEEVAQIDYLCCGEGEQTFEQFLGLLEKGGDSSSVDGLYYRQNGKIITPQPRKLMTPQQLDGFPYPAWDVLLKRGFYRETLNYTDRPFPVFSVETARGCPFECTFCDEKSIWERVVREKSIDRVVSEIAYVVEKFNANHFYILDDVFTLKKDRVRDFTNKVKKLNINYRITAKVNSVTEEMMKDLKESGCRIVSYGVESGDEKVLKIMKKRQTLEQVKRAFEMTNRSGMISFALCMVGNIGEDFESVKKTAKFIKEINSGLASVAIMTPYPGSENYRICEENNWILSRDWSHWTPSPIRLKDWQPVTRTDKMDKKLMLKSYYYLQRQVIFNKFRKKYGRFYYINYKFYWTELFVRLKGIGLKGFFRHISRLARSAR